MLQMIGTILLVVVGSLVLFLLLVLFFVKFAPVFGAMPSAEQRQAYQKHPNYAQGRFQNLQPRSTVVETPNFIDNSIHPRPERRPQKSLPYETLATADLLNPPEQARIVWFGHSTFLIDLDGVRLLVDPMFGHVPSPLPPFGGVRFSKGLPLDVQDLPPIDAIVLTHDHYDHLDYGSILKLKDRVKDYVVPLGMSAHLMRWGIPKEQIREFNWYASAKVGLVELILTPTHHYSGRSLQDRFQSLWGGWVLLGQKQRLYISGDGGYGPHFKEIGATYGPFDLAMIECGQYSRFWRQNHLFPEQSALVAAEVGARYAMPIHWGAFTLAMHRWSDPPERFITRAEELGINVVTPKIGEPMVIYSDPEKMPQERWWRQQ